MEAMMNREQRRAARRAKPPRRGAGHIQMPITMRFSAQDETQMMLVPTQSADKFLASTAEEADWHTVMMRINWARLLNEAHFNEGVQEFEAARLVMRAVKPVGLADGIWSMTAEQYETVNTALVLANQMQKQCTRRELQASLKEMLGANAYNKRADAIKDKLDART
jgi:hypothetical protein